MNTPKEKRVHEVFETISDNYDQMNGVISFQQHMRWRADTMRMMAVHPGARALDVCCGTGDWTVALAEAVGPTGEVKGLDFSAGMLSIADQKAAAFPQIEFIEGNAMRLPFEDNSFDYVTIGFGLRNVPDAFEALQEMNRVLKPGGLAVCLETSQPEGLLFRPLFRLYFRYVMPLFGRLFAKSYKEYSWLQESARDFPGMRALADLFQRAGFVAVSFKPYSGGAAAVHFGRKPALAAGGDGTRG